MTGRIRTPPENQVRLAPVGSLDDNAGGPLHIHRKADHGEPSRTIGSIVHRYEGIKPTMSIKGENNRPVSYATHIYREQGRPAKQQRSMQRRERICDAALTVIAEDGITNVTHRRVAQHAHVSLAATTYYFATKADLITDASVRLLFGYVDGFYRFEERHRGNPQMTFAEFTRRVVVNSAGRHRIGTLAWCEIMVDAARNDETRGLARTWFTYLENLWSKIADALGFPKKTAIHGLKDIAIGLLFTVVPLGLSPEQVTKVLCEQIDVLESWCIKASVTPPSDKGSAKSRKAKETRERVLAAAVSLLMADRPTTVTYQAVAAAAGLSPAAPTYYYPTIESLLREARISILEQTDIRHRQVMDSLDYKAFNLETLIDLTSMVLIRDVTEFRQSSIAAMAMRLDAAREPDLRPVVWASVADQICSWKVLIDHLTPNASNHAALLLQALFTGKMVRILATGGSTQDLIDLRSEFCETIPAILNSQLRIS